MGATEEKIALIIEAYNKTKGAFTELDNSLKDISDSHKKIGPESESVFSQMKASWLAISVVIAEVGLIVKEAFDFAELGAKAEQAEESFRQVAASMGENADQIIADMKRVSAGTVDDSDIMQKAVKGMMQGLSGDQLVDIMKAARVAARVTGQEVGQAYETITDAIANKMPRALKQYGLITQEQLKLLEASMAAGINTTDLAALVLANASDQRKKLTAEEQNDLEVIQNLKVVWSELKEIMGIALIEALKKFKDLMIWVYKFEESTIGMVNNLYLLGAILNKVGLLSDEKLSKLTASVTKINETLAGTEKKPPSTNSDKPGKSAKELEKEIKDALSRKKREAEIQREMTNLDIAEKNRDISHLDAAQKRVDLAEKLLKTQENNLALIDKNAVGGDAAWAAQQKAIDETRKKLAEFTRALRELNGTFGEGFKEGFNTYLDGVKTVFQQAKYLAEETAKAMETAFSDFFFDAMTGKLKNFSDYIKSFLESIARAMANVLAQNTAGNLIKAFMNAYGGGSSGGGTTMAGDLIPTGHTGGLVMHGGGYIGYAPRFHAGGLSSDEVPAILQKGEYVVSRKGVDALDKINSGDAGGGGNVNVQVVLQNNSGQDLNAKSSGQQWDGKKWVVGVILEDVEHGGHLRNLFKGLK